MAMDDEVLDEVREMGPATVAQVATGLGRSVSTVRRIIRRLEEAGMVESCDYQRRSRVFLATDSTTGEAS